MEEDIIMDKQSKIFFLVMFFIVLASLSYGYYRFIFAETYGIIGHAKCDPATEACFVKTCDSTAEECTGDPAQDTSYYKIVKKMARNIPLCDPSDENCDALVCQEGEAGCEETLCSEDTTEEGIVCSDPEVYKASLESVPSNTAIPQDDTTLQNSTVPQNNSTPLSGIVSE